MTSILIILVLLFFLAILAQKIFGKNFCAMCLSVSLTWIIVFIWGLFFGELDTVALGILMGGSAVGFMYFVFRFNEKFQFFKFPFLIFLFWFVYQLIKGVTSDFLKEGLIVGVIWAVFAIVYLFRNNRGLRDWSERIVECCKNW